MFFCGMVPAQIQKVKPNFEPCKPNFLFYRGSLSYSLGLLAQTSLPPLPPLTPSFRQVKPSVSIPRWATNRIALSQMIDLAAWETQLAQSTITGRATLLSEASVGGRAFLNAVPSGRTQMEPAAFLSELRVRLQVPDAASDTWCPLCDAVLDHNSHHAGMCVAGGERTQRHHAVRDLVHTWCHRAGLRPEDMNNSQARRPADVYLPAFAGSPTAFDFAITAPQRQETLAQASVRTAAAAEAYARHKELHLHTAQACEQQGVKFAPLVAECTGTWDPSALKVLKHVAHAAAAKTGEEPAVCYNQLLQELGRAALRRRFEAS